MHSCSIQGCPHQGFSTLFTRDHRSVVSMSKQIQIISFGPGAAAWRNSQLTPMIMTPFLKSWGHPVSQCPGREAPYQCPWIVFFGGSVEEQMLSIARTDDDFTVFARCLLRCAVQWSWLCRSLPVVLGQLRYCIRSLVVSILFCSSLAVWITLRFNYFVDSHRYMQRQNCS